MTEVVSKSGKQTEEKKVKSIDIVWFDKNDEEKDADFMVQILLTRQTFTLKTVFSFKNSIRDGTFKIPAYDEELSAAMIFQLFSLQIKEMIKQKMYIDPGEIDGQFDIKFVKNEFIPSLYWTILESSCEKTYNITDGNKKDLILQLLNEIEKLKTFSSPCVIYLYRKDIPLNIETPLHIPFQISELESNTALLKKFCSLGAAAKESANLSIQIMSRMMGWIKKRENDCFKSNYPLIINTRYIPPRYDNRYEQCQIYFEKHVIMMNLFTTTLQITQEGYLLSVKLYLIMNNIKKKVDKIGQVYYDLNDISKVFSKKNILLGYSQKLKNAKSHSFSIQIKEKARGKTNGVYMYANGMYNIIISNGYLYLQNDFFYTYVEGKMSKTNRLKFDVLRGGSQIPHLIETYPTALSINKIYELPLYFE